jgi:hypothetical protein
MSFISAVRPLSRLLLPLALLVAGCTSSPPDSPAYDVGAIEGRILGGGLPVAAWVRARPVDQDSYTNLEVKTDSTGSYSIAVPSGAYYIEVVTNTANFYYGPTGPRWDRAAGDSVHVGRDVVRADIEVGRLDVEIHSSLPSSPIRCELNDESRERTDPLAIEAEDGTLRCTFPAIPPGVYTLRLRTNDSELWLPGSIDRGEAGRIRVDEGASVEYTASLDSWARVSGRDVGCWTDGSGFDIYAFNSDSSLAGRTYGGSDGTFEMDLLLAQPVRILTERGGILRWVGGPDFQGATVFDLHARETLNDLALVESGIACDFDSLVNGGTTFRVTLVGETGHLYANRAYLESPLRIPNLEPGSYRLRLESERATGWVPQWYDGGDSASMATPIVISHAGEIARVTMHLVQGGKLLGRITTGSGSPIAGREIWFSRDHDGVPDYYEEGDTSDLDGRFAIIGLEDGDYTIGTTSDYGVSWYPGTADQGAAERIAIRDHGVAEGIEWQVQ